MLYVYEERRRGGWSDLGLRDVVIMLSAIWVNIGGGGGRAGCLGLFWVLGFGF